VVDPTSAGYRALVVDDEAALAGVVASYLEREQFEVSLAHTGPDALTVAREVDPDVVVLDLGLPGIDGIEVCRRLRTFSDAYVVMLTARDTELDTIVGLSVGADDYLTKPFSPLRIDVAGRQVYLDDEPIVLTRTEFDVLAVLAAHPGVVLSRRQLLETVWETGYVGNEHLVDVHIGHLRRKLGDDPAAPRYVMTVRGVGYRMGTGR
jgi:DNA-binding response OmpR family regulator